jgi:glycosyltransferase involved in cell wall biosynthesis
LSGRGVEVTFVLPKAVGDEYHDRVKLLSPQSASASIGDRSPAAVASTYAMADAAPEAAEPWSDAAVSDEAEVMPDVRFKAVPSKLASVYPGGELHHAADEQGISFLRRGANARHDPQPSATDARNADASPPIRDEYADDLMSEVRRFRDLCVDLARGESFDVVHAHDWMTFPAAAAVAEAAGVPMIAHFHSTEFDRAGENVNTQITQIEHWACQRAERVLTVSHYTRQMLSRRYGVDESRVTVVYNGVDRGSAGGGADDGAALPPAIRKSDKVVLYLGRVTMQKGPEYFIAAAKKVLQKLDQVKFVMAGSGDKVQQVIDLAAREGIGHKITFTGFLHGDDVQRVFEMADVYVMPSVSEPFGISTLEAISHDVPVILSKTSGVSEVLQHVLKVDFWDTDEMANQILAVLRHPPLGQTLRRHADVEVRKLTWDGAAGKVEQVYEQLGAGSATEGHL